MLAGRRIPLDGEALLGRGVWEWREPAETPADKTLAPQDGKVALPCDNNHSKPHSRPSQAAAAWDTLPHCQCPTGWQSGEYLSW
jgi:hypothetical protein